MPASSPIPGIVQAARQSAPVMFIGLDGADWELLDRYMKAGSMPVLRQLTGEGVHGRLETLHPALSPLIWTSMMTGVDPLRHGILDFVRFRPGTDQKEPITSDERKAPAIWNMASWADRSVAVFGLWATYPAEPVKGLLVSDRLFTFLFKEATPPEGVVFPRDREPWARQVVEEAEAAVDYAALRHYLPDLTEDEFESALRTEQPYGNPVSALHRTLVETQVYDALASSWLQNESPDLTILYIQGTDTIGHTFAPYAPPRQASISDTDYARYSGVPEKYFAALDALIGRYRDVARQRGAALVLASDHGFTWSDDRPTELSSNAHATAAKWHRRHGMYLLWGPDIAAQDVRDQPASVLQVAPTLIALAGLPTGRELTSPPLPGTPASHAETVQYGSHFTPPQPAAAAGAARTVDEDTLARLRALGYIGAAESSSGRKIDPTRSAGSYNNEGLLLKAAGRTDDALKAFENALVVDPNLASAMWNLSDLLFASGQDLDRSDILLARAFGSGLPEGTKYLVGRAIGYQRSGQLDRSLKLLESALRIKADDAEVWLFSGRYRVEKGDCAGGVSDMEKAVRLEPGNPATHASLGLARMCAGDTAGARRELRRSLELNPSQTAVREYLSKLGG
ncbi:MAG TPA: alkaline phosphatase family protein [Vicinamibacterales bacterium]|nr:alkaline phosphatase family protein [Vicinamibacterales bacterium]